MGRPVSEARSSRVRSCRMAVCRVALTTWVRAGIPARSHSIRASRVSWSAPSSGCATVGSAAWASAGCGAGAASAGR
ncbi:hypothetical protein SGRIM128S_07574 [Streptomyces griseomycini]